jgi:catechol 2,3-dioxygenase-like lactoylglutathione lyase family enzyme
MFLGLRTAIYPAPDLAAAKKWYSEVLGAAELEAVTEVGHGIKVASVQDPFGNRLGIIENPNFNTADMR